MDGIQSRLADLFQLRWSALLIRGLIAIGVGILFWARPGHTLAILVLLFGIWAFVDGIVTCYLAFQDRPEKSWGWMLLDGLLGIAVGLFAFFRPAATAVGLLILVGIWAIFRGIFEIAVAISLRKELKGEWRLLVAGILSVLFGITVLARPGAGLLAVLWLLGFYAVLYGVMMVMLAFKARSLGNRLSATEV